MGTTYQLMSSTRYRSLPSMGQTWSNQLTDPHDPTTHLRPGNSLSYSGESNGFMKIAAAPGDVESRRSTGSPNGSPGWLRRPDTAAWLNSKCTMAVATASQCGALLGTNLVFHNDFEEDHYTTTTTIRNEKVSAVRYFQHFSTRLNLHRPLQCLSIT